MQKKQAGRSGQKIANETILLFASTAMITTERYSWYNDSWEDRVEDQKTWADWKASYKKAHAKARVKAQTAEGANKFGAANAAERFLKNSEAMMDDGGDEMRMKAL